MKEFDLSSIADALRPVTSEYMADVRRIAEDALAEFPRCEAEAEEWKAEEDRREYVHTSVDGSWWVIYTYAAQAVAMCSENDGAFEEMGISPVEDGMINWSLIAYCAMEADVMAHLAALTAD